MEALTREEIEMCEIAVGIILDSHDMTSGNKSKWDLLWDKLERMQKEASQPTAQADGHNPKAWKDGADAWQNGYDDAMYDGIDTASEMPCKCKACRKAYYEGQEAAMKEISGGAVK